MLFRSSLLLTFRSVSLDTPGSSHVTLKDEVGERVGAWVHGSVVWRWWWCVSLLAEVCVWRGHGSL